MRVALYLGLGALALALLVGARRRASSPAGPAVDANPEVIKGGGVVDVLVTDAPSPETPTLAPLPEPVGARVVLTAVVSGDELSAPMAFRASGAPPELRFEPRPPRQWVRG